MAASAVSLLLSFFNKNFFNFYNYEGFYKLLPTKNQETKISSNLNPWYITFLLFCCLIEQYGIVKCKGRHRLLSKDIQGVQQK